MLKKEALLDLEDINLDLEEKKEKKEKIVEKKEKYDEKNNCKYLSSLRNNFLYQCSEKRIF